MDPTIQFPLFKTSQVSLMVTQVVRMWTEEPLEAFSVAKEPHSCVLFRFKSEHPRGKQKIEVGGGTNCVRPTLWVCILGIQSERSP